MKLRTRLLDAGEIQFQMDISADYGDKLHLFSLDCTSDRDGNVTFQVKAPDTIAGITGMISEGNGQLTFDDMALHFELLTDRQLSPVSAPWVFLKALRSGYLTAAGKEDGIVRLTIQDTYEEDALQVDIWLNDQDVPQHAEILYDGKNILSMVVKDFRIL